MSLAAFWDQFSNFATTFLGIFIEAAPFLLMGSAASGLVEVFVSKDEIARLIPRNRLSATVMGGLMGFVFPVCECGVVPLTRRLFRKGLPVPAGIAFLLAAPILNPVVVASTYAAYGWSPVFYMRFVLGLAISLGVGLIFSLHERPWELLRMDSFPLITGASPEFVAAESEEVPLLPLTARLRSAMQIAADDFFEMGQYLIAGSLLAALMQTLVPQSTLVSLGSGPLVSVLTMQILAYVLSVCSTVDAFVSLAFINAFTTGSILAFLVFGPMVDIKSTLMFSGVFRRKYVLYLVLLPFLLMLVVGVFINLYTGL